MVPEKRLEDKSFNIVDSGPSVVRLLVPMGPFTREEVVQRTGVLISRGSSPSHDEARHVTVIASYVEWDVKP